MTFFLNQKKVLPSVSRGLLNQFQKGSKKAVYPTTRSEIRTFNHPNDSVYFEANNVFHNQLTNRVILHHPSLNVLHACITTSFKIKGSYHPLLLSLSL